MNDQGKDPIERARTDWQKYKQKLAESRMVSAREDARRVAWQGYERDIPVLLAEIDRLHKRLDANRQLAESMRWTLHLMLVPLPDEDQPKPGGDE